MNKEFMQGNKKAQQLLLLILAALFALFFLIRLIAGPRLHAWLLAMEPEKAIRILSTALSVVFLMAIPPGAIFLRIAQKTVAAGRFPPPGTRLLRNARLHEGTSAYALALLFTLVGLCVIALALWGAFTAYTALPALIAN